MNLPKDPKADLQTAIQGGLAIVVAGTGVSISASYDSATKQCHPQASWTGLLESGLALLRKHDLISEAEAAAHLTLLKGSPDTPQFIATAHAITREMSDRKFREWLQQTVGSIKSNDRSLLDALEEIRLCGNLLATTNYDGLLLEGRPHLTAVTWNEDAAFLDTHRHKRTNCVLFLHGHWDAPKSVILDEKSYQAITRDEQYRQDLTAVWRTSTWIYVGCGENGLSDPDVGLLLHLYGQRARQDGHWDFCLVRNGEKDRFQRYFNEKGYNICAVSFGEKHEHLTPFLRSLLPAAMPPAPAPISSVTPAPSTQPTIPHPPALYAEPDYIGSHKFVGRARELEELTDWAKPADPTNLLLFEAIGGNGKSMLTWEWTKNHALAARPTDSPWAGRFWYSFYERGAIMADFCHRALAYMTGRPLADFVKKKTAEMKDELLAQLHARPWLFILDGLERVLVAYHRIDAAEVPDEEANAPTDQIANRNPTDAIRDEDNDLLRALAAANPSKLLVSSRLTPRVLLNPSGQPIPGGKRITLPGLRPPDAHSLLRSCGIEGNSAAIQSYLTANCDNHPLVIGILGGIIANYLPDRGNFDMWSTAADGGAALDFASLDLIQRRNHILRAALDALPPTSKQLLSTLALLTDSVDYETLKAFNPHLPPEPEEVEKPEPPEKNWDWDYDLSEEEKAKRQKQYEAALSRWQDYDKAVQARLASAEFRSAPKLQSTVRDLEQRGLLQWDGHARKYDLHPVVRGVGSGGMALAERDRHGQRVVDHFSAQPHRPYKDAETMEDMHSGLHVVRTLIRMRRNQRAASELRNGFLGALYENLDAHSESLSLLRPLFPDGWAVLPREIRESDAAYLTNSAANALSQMGQRSQALEAYETALKVFVRLNDWANANINLMAVATAQTMFATQERCLKIGITLAEVADDGERLFSNRLRLFQLFVAIGRWDDAHEIWSAISATKAYSVWPEVWVELQYAGLLHREGRPNQDHWRKVEEMVERERRKIVLRYFHGERGNCQVDLGEWAAAAASHQESVRLARERGITDEDSETGLALAKHHLGQLPSPRDEAERLAQLHPPGHRYLAMLWLAIGDPEQAKHHALVAYKRAWADGEPYVLRYELTKTTELLQQMNVPIPNLPPYDPAKDKPLPWEAEVRAAIEKLRVEKEAKKTKKVGAEN
jgi:tetratricopeptide (TPR) repeat protein